MPYFYIECDVIILRNMNIPIEAVAADNPDGTHVMVLVNPSERKGQVQYFYGEKCWYIELMPNSVSTVVFE